MKQSSIIKPNGKGFEISCKNKDCIGGMIQTTLDNDSGYSNWTVMGSGKVAFKCHGCGKYGSTAEYDNPNELSNFEVSCLECGKRNKWDYSIGDVDGESKRTYIECKSCGQRISSFS